MKKAILALADGARFYGKALGFEGETVGEVVFNTAMTGYQEILITGHPLRVQRRHGNRRADVNAGIRRV